jgi:hypothetical protein
LRGDDRGRDRPKVEIERTGRGGWRTGVGRAGCRSPHHSRTRAHQLAPEVRAELAAICRIA